MNSFTSAASFGLSLRNAHAVAPSSASARSGRGLIFGSRLAQISAFQLSTTMTLSSPTASMSIMSSSSSASGRSVRVICGLSSARKRWLRRMRLS